MNEYIYNKKYHNNTINIFLNIFIPIHIFKNTNILTIYNLFDELKYIDYDIELFLIGYCFDNKIINEIKNIVSKLKLLLKSKIIIYFKIYSNYNKIVSKCNLLNKFMSLFVQNNYFLYIEYDILLKNLKQNVNKFFKIINNKYLNNDEVILCFSANHECHQLSIYEQQLKLDDEIILLRPLNNNGNIIGTGCFYIYSNLKQINNIVCDSYGYGNDDFHVYNWLHKNNKKIKNFMYVISDFNVIHNSIKFDQFDDWKKNIILKNIKLNKNDYTNFWNGVIQLKL